MNTPTHNNNVNMEEESIDIKKYFFIMLANWYWFALSIFICLFTSYLVNRYSEPIYSVTSSLIIREDDNMKGFTGAENLIQGLRLVKNTKSVQNEIGILKSYTLARRSIEELGSNFSIKYVGIGRRGIKEAKLYKNSPFKVTLDTTNGIPYNQPIYLTILSTKEYQLEIDGGLNINEKHKFGEWIKINTIGFKVELSNLEGYRSEIIDRKFYFSVQSTNELAKRYKNNINVTLNDKRGSILSITSDGFVPAQEADYLNKLMEVYIRSGLEDKNRIAENTIKFIDKQLIDVSDSLRIAEQKLQNFRINNKIIDLSAEGALLFEKLKILQDQKAVSEIKKRYYGYLIEYLKERSDLKDIVAPTSLGIEDPQLSILLDQISQTYIQREGLLLTINIGSPTLAQIDSRLANLNKTLKEKVLSLIEANMISAQDIEQQLAELDKQMLRIPSSQRMLINTEREFNLMNKQYTYLLEKRAEAGIAKASNIADNKVLDFALPENALLLKPNHKMNNLMGFLIGLFLPMSILLFINFLNDKITDLKEIGKFTTTPIVGSVGHNKFSTDLPVVEKPKSTITESFRAIRTNLQYMLRNPEQKVIAVTSTISGEGKTFITANLAAIIASANKKVLVIGLDLRKPKLQNIFGSNTQKGLSTYLIRRDSEEDIIQSTNIENLWYAPSGPIPPNPAELIGSSRMDEFINWAKAKFDYIIIDTPPIAIVTDALLAQRFSDATLFVIRFKYSSKDVLNFVESLNTADGSRSVGIVINDLQHKRVYGYTYGYAYTYGYNYGSGYGYYNDKNGYYTDEEQPLTFKDKILRFFS